MQKEHSRASSEVGRGSKQRHKLLGLASKQVGSEAACSLERDSG